jgi:hypothetical protein
MYLVQLNVAYAIADLDDPIMADFVNNTDRINALAENHEGFIWRHKGEESNSNDGLEHFNDSSALPNMSVWRDKQSLFNYVYNSDHVEIFKRKKEWFAKPFKMHMVLWFIKKDHTPTITEAKQRLDYLIKNGESPYAFSFKSDFSSQDL